MSDNKPEPVVTQEDRETYSKIADMHVHQHDAHPNCHATRHLCHCGHGWFFRRLRTSSLFDHSHGHRDDRQLSFTTAGHVGLDSLFLANAPLDAL